MAGIAAGGEVQPGPTARNPGQRRAAGIYGAIITAAILDTAGGRLSTEALVITVVVTLLVYWLAEEYAEVLGEQAAGGALPGWAYVRRCAGRDLADGQRVISAAAGAGGEPGWRGLPRWRRPTPGW